MTELSLIDWFVCLTYLTVVFGLALKSARGQHNNEDYFVGGRSMNWWVDITQAAHSGENQLEVDIANTWANRLVGDAHLPEGKHFCQTNITRSETPSKPWQEIQLRKSGLLGPVQLIPAVVKIVLISKLRQEK